MAKEPIGEQQGLPILEAGEFRALKRDLGIRTGEMSDFLKERQLKVALSRDGIRKKLRECEDRGESVPPLYVQALFIMAKDKGLEEVLLSGLRKIKEGRGE